MAVDWFTGIIGYDARALKLGRMVRFSADGDVEWDVDTKRAVEGSWSSQMMIGRGFATDAMRMFAARNGYRCPMDCLYVSGNPAKFLQGHNVFGPSVSLLGPVMREAVRRFPDAVRPPDAGEERWPALHRSRVDTAVMVALPTHDAVHEWLNGAAAFTRSRHGRPLVSGTTVYWGQHSRRWSMKAYCKFCELMEHRPEQHFHELSGYCENQLRLELTLRGQEMKPRGTLTEDVVWEYWRRVVVGVPKVDFDAMDRKILESSLPSGAKTALLLWTGGKDVRFGVLTKATFYRYRRQILSLFGIDISRPRDDQAEKVEALGYSADWLKAHQVQEPPEELQPLLFKPSGRAPFFTRGGVDLSRYPRRAAEGG